MFETFPKWEQFVSASVASAARRSAEEDAALAAQRAARIEAASGAPPAPAPAPAPASSPHSSQAETLPEASPASTQIGGFDPPTEHSSGRTQPEAEASPAAAATPPRWAERHQQRRQPRQDMSRRLAPGGSRSRRGRSSNGKLRVSASR